MPQQIKDHLHWIAGYCEVANDRNWRDMLHMIEEQVRRAKRDAAQSPSR